MIISIGEFIRFFRKKHSLSQEQLAEILECTRKGLSKIENGLSSPRSYTIKLFEDYFKVTLNRFYQNNDENLPLSSFELMSDILYTVGRGDLKRGYNLACDLERSSHTKNAECWLNIHYAKARFYAGVADNYHEALNQCALGLKYEPYIAFNKDNENPLHVESFLPSISSLQLIYFTGFCFSKIKETVKATLVLEEGVGVLNNLFNEPLLLDFLYKKEEVCIAFAGLCLTLAQIYYNQKRFSEALSIIERSLKSIRNYRVSVFMFDQYYIKFKSLCSLMRYNDALSILQETIFYCRFCEPDGERRLNAIVLELGNEFPQVSDSLSSMIKLFSAMEAIGNCPN